MCGRYYRRSDKQAIAEHFAANVYDFELPDDYNVAPQSTQPVVRVNRDTGEREVALMRWGLIPVLVEGRQDRLLHDQCEVRDGRHQRDVPRGVQAPPLPGAGLRFLRVGEVGRQDEAALRDRLEGRFALRLRRHLGEVERQGHATAARNLQHTHHGG